MNKNVTISTQSPRQNNNPYYISDIKEEVLVTLGVNYININNINKIKLNTDKYNKYIINFKEFIENELDIIYNIYKIGSNTDNTIDKINDHINNLNEYTTFINKIVIEL
tara:strand:- start:2097 stop:2423 length:327 start_codon:yes stop_codon:yes gene_type:complete